MNNGLLVFLAWGLSSLAGGFVGAFTGDLTDIPYLPAGVNGLVQVTLFALILNKQRPGSFTKLVAWLNQKGD